MPTFHIKGNPDSPIKIDPKRVKVIVGGRVVEPAQAEEPKEAEVSVEKPKRKGKNK